MYGECCANCVFLNWCDHEVVFVKGLGWNFILFTDQGDFHHPFVVWFVSRITQKQLKGFP